MSSNNAIVGLVTQGGPVVRESQVDSKKDLEKALKVTCEEFIMTCTKLTVEPMLSFITKVTAVKVAALQGGSGAAGGESDSRRLRDHAFAAPEKLAEIVQSVNEALDTKLPTAVGKMKLYLQHPNTRNILFKPIQSNIAEAHGQIAQLLEAEYTPDDAAGIGLLGATELGQKLDLLS
ncbi:hypothetical protein CYMTET_19466 [Cymbomonas tetramitiformis]|uniref:Uncharacterized protein n=1 Tax=Cymbomonas tetramitiformis TaxID=36881 RepID=A0AAE0L558_9CHLO|nr:hypothetical protein CYMTET_19466 [Cymbomonas tetramitiformis]